MGETQTSRIDKVVLEVVRKGPCEACGGEAVRIRTIAAATQALAESLLQDWQETPLLHQRCEA